MDSLSHNSSSKDEKNENGEINGSKSREGKPKWTDIWMVFLTAVLAIGTLLVYWDATHQTESARVAF